MPPTIQQDPADPLCFILDFSPPADFVTDGDYMRDVLRRLDGDPTLSQRIAVEQDITEFLSETACQTIRHGPLGAWFAAMGVSYGLDGSSVYGSKCVRLTLPCMAGAVLFKLAWG